MPQGVGVHGNSVWKKLAGVPGITFNEFAFFTPETEPRIAGRARSYSNRSVLL